jgi:serine/threonine-protein kinase
LDPGSIIGGKYRVDDVLGEGGMGSVVAVTRIADGERFAVKVMLANVAEDEDMRRRFMREARAARALDSDHVARVFDVGTMDESGTPYMVLELLEGESLSDVIDDRAPLPIDEAVDYLLQACVGVARAHARGIVHRDIKPSNLFLAQRPDGPPIVKVLDFGISKTSPLDNDTRGSCLTETNAMLGSPQYMSPEQLRSAKTVDARSDVWSLGLVLYKALTGLMAFEADSLGAHFAMIMTDAPTALRQRRPDAPEALEAAILRCLHKDVARRWQDVSQLACAIEPYASEHARPLVAEIEKILADAGVLAPRDEAAEDSSVEMPPTIDSLRSAALPARALPEGMAAEPMAGEGPTRSTWHAGERKPATPPRRIALWVGMAALVVVGGLAGAGFVSKGVGESDTPGPATSSGRVEGSAEPVKSSEAMISLRVDVRPIDARIALDGAVMRDNPLRLRKGEEHEIVVSAAGHVAERRIVRAERDEVISVSLEREAAPAAASSASAAPARTPVASVAPIKSSAPPAASATPAQTAPQIKPKGPLENEL